MSEFQRDPREVVFLFTDRAKATATQASISGQIVLDPAQSLSTSLVAALISMAMRKRIGQVVGWAGNIVAAIWLSVTFPQWSDGTDFTGPVVAGAIFLIGQALRYIFAGSDDSVVS